MVEITEREINAIHETKEKVVRIDTLLGNGDSGLCRDVAVSKNKIHRIEIILAFSFGSAGLGGGVVAAAKLLGG